VIRRGCLLAGALAASTGCLLYTNRINRGPEVTIDGPSMVFRGERPPFTAMPSDPDQDAGSLLVDWRAQKLEPGGACPPADGGLNVPPAPHVGLGATNTRFTLDGLTTPGRTCVWVTVHDDEGASAVAGRTLEVQNHTPEAKIEIVKADPGAGDTFALYRPVHLTAAKSIDLDDDHLNPLWHLTSPDGTMRIPEACPMPPGDVCVALERPGPYVFELEVSDPYGGVSRQTRTLTVAEDHPPCIETTMPDFRVGATPIYQKSTEPLRFELDVADDDGDPYPEAGDRATLVWEWRFDDDPAPSRQVHSYAVLDFRPGDLALHAGHQLTVRLTYQDRMPRDLSSCSATDPLCELPPALPMRHCYQRVGWKVQIY
jgi:hypothetical protein